jgi:hypothetical protein
MKTARLIAGPLLAGKGDLRMRGVKTRYEQAYPSK